MEYKFNFVGYINDENVLSLISFINQCNDITKLTINISSLGGSVTSGIYVYNFLKQVNFEVITHNSSEVSSAAILLYLAGSTRTAEDISKFIIHPISIGIGGDLPYFKIKELLNTIDIDIKNYTMIVNNETNNLQEKHSVEEHLKGESLILNKKQALECSIVTNV